ncbi:MAG: hypothetical protein PF638_04275 [Candidatus Delongbacteria bacterium]|jgi:predicted esterase YcpF (UPF0227 family)|nr:hypothetical protein [Candidatus Delongbacteria bacterium]
MLIYLHGFNSFTSQERKKWLRENIDKDLYAPEFDWTKDGVREVCEYLEVLVENTDDLTPTIMGKSLGGLIAKGVAANLGLNLIMINPSLYPADSLRTAENIRIEHYKSGNIYFTGEFVDRLEREKPSGHFGGALVLLDEGDEVLDSNATFEELKDHYHVIMYPGGNHRFQHWEEAKDEIKKMCNWVCPI